MHFVSFIAKMKWAPVDVRKWKASGKNWNGKIKSRGGTEAQSRRLLHRNRVAKKSNNRTTTKKKFLMKIECTPSIPISHYIFCVWWSEYVCFSVRFLHSVLAFFLLFFSCFFFDSSHRHTMMIVKWIECARQSTRRKKAPPTTTCESAAVKAPFELYAE